MRKKEKLLGIPASGGGKLEKEKGGRMSEAETEIGMEREVGSRPGCRARILFSVWWK